MHKEKKENNVAKPILTEKELQKRKSKRTKVAVASFVLLLGVGVLGNWYYENTEYTPTGAMFGTAEKTKTLGEATYVDGTTVPEEEQESEYFASARVERQTARDTALDKLQAIIDKTDESEDARKVAAEKMAQLSSNISAENKMETLVCAKGVEHCLAVVSEDGTQVNIIVDCKELSDTLIMQIKDIAMQQLSCSFEDVTVIQSKQK